MTMNIYELWMTLDDYESFMVNRSWSFMIIQTAQISDERPLSFFPASGFPPSPPTFPLADEMLDFAETTSGQVRRPHAAT